MTSIAEVDVLRLKADAALVAVVSSRIYRQRAKQDGPLPDIILVQGASPEDETQEGRSGLVLVRMQYHCYGRTGVEAEQVAGLVEDCLDTTTYEHDGITLQTACSCARMDVPYEGETRVYGVGVEVEYWAYRGSL